jgi:DNA polymerase-3 subunit delta
MDYRGLGQKISAGIIYPVYLFHGTEKLLLEEAIKQLRGKLEESPHPWLNYHVLQGKEERAAAILEKARSMALFRGRILILVQEADLLPRTEKEKLIPYLQNPPSSTCLILQGDTLSPFASLVPYIKAKGAIVDFSPLSPTRTLTWIKEWVEGMGGKITSEAARYLVENNGTNLLFIKNELEKVMTFKGGKGSLIDLTDLKQIGWSTATHTIFELTEALGNRKKEEALYLLQKLLRQGEAPLLILNLIIRHFRHLWQIKELQRNNYPLDQIEKLMGLLPYQAKKYRLQARRFSEDELKKVFCRFTEIDLYLKSTDIPAKILLENFIWNLAD